MTSDNERNAHSDNNTPAFVAKLSTLGVVSIIGEKRHDYLQGQLTINVKEWSNDHAKLGCHCDFKGKVWQVFTAINADNAVYLVGHKEGASASLPELKKYGVFSKVDIRDTSEDWQIYGVMGEPYTVLINTLFPLLSDKHLSSTQNEFGIAVQYNDVSQRYLLLLTEKGERRLIDIIEDTKIENDTPWEQLEIEAGLGNIQQANINEFVPQMLNLQALDAIDFKKGCYMGQEVVARTKYLGKNKRASFILRADSKNTDKEQLKAGATLEIKLQDNWRRAGTIIRSAVGDTIVAMAVLPNDTQKTDVLRLKEAPSVEFTLCELPYSLGNS